MDSDWKKFTLFDGTKILAQPCFEIVAFSFAPPKTCGPGFKHFLKTFMNHWGQDLTFYAYGDTKGRRAFATDKLDAPYEWMDDPKILEKKMLGFSAHSGETKDQINSPSIDISLMGFQSPPCFVFKITLPVSAVEKSDGLISFIQEVLKKFPLASGYAGYSLNWDNLDSKLDDKVCKWAAPLLKQHPGLNYGKQVALSNAAVSSQHRIAVINWLTFLGQELCEALNKKKPPVGISSLPLGKGGCILRAGPAPQLGDLKKKDFVPIYHTVGQYVEPLRATPESFQDVLVEGLSEKEMDQWLQRFFV